MNGLQQGWLVALREMRERSRSRGFRVGLGIMILVVVAMIAVPALIDRGAVTTDVGFTGAFPADLPRTTSVQGADVDVRVRVHRYADVAAGEQAVRDQDIDVLVVDARRLEWRGDPDVQLRGIVTASIQLVAVQERAAAAGIDPDELVAVLTPVPVENVELGITEGRGPEDGTVALVMTGLLLLAISVYGNLVLTGVVEEKSSRVVEVLLARMPARTLLAGKVVGVGLLGFAQFVVTALAALVATVVVDAVDLPAAGGAVLTWVVVWFVLGYALYATAYGALGSLASRMEDAQSVAGPVIYVLIAGYFASFASVSADPESGWSVFLSVFPATAPLAMPGRIALGAVTWWEPLLAVTVSVAAIVGLVVLGGRVYTGAILHTGPTLKLREAWRDATRSGPATETPDTGRPGPGVETPPSAVGLTAARKTPGRTDRAAAAIPIVIGAAFGAAVVALTRDFVIGLAVGAAVYAIGARILKARQPAHR